MDQKILALINLYKTPGSNYWTTAQVRAIDDDSFYINGRQRIVFRDEDLKTDEDGKVIIDLEPLDFKSCCGNVDLPKTFEMPLGVLAARKEKRRLNALAKDALAIVPYRGENMYFYLEGENLRILRGEKEVTAEKIEIIHGRKAVNVEGLELEHPYFELPVNVAAAFEDVLKWQELKKLCLVSVGKNQLNGKTYYRISGAIPDYMFEPVKDLFEYWEDLGGYTGLVTPEARVSTALGIPIQETKL